MGILGAAFGVAIAPAFPLVRRLLGLSEDTPEAQALRRFLKFWNRDNRRTRRRVAAVRAPRPRRTFAYPQQLPTVAPDGALVAATDLELLEHDRLLFVQADDVWGAANVLNLIGFIRERHGEFDQALHIHRQALALFEGIEELLGIGDSHNNLGVVLARMGKPSAALAHHQRALVIREPRDAVRVSNSHNNIAVVLATESNEEARMHLREAARISEASEEDSRGMGKIINNATVLEIETGCEEGRGEQLCEQFEKALALRSASEDQRGNAKTQNNLGIVHALEGDYVEAEKHFGEAATLAGSVEDNVSLVNVLSNWRQLAAAAEAPEGELKNLDDRIAAGRDVIKGKPVTSDCEAFPLKCETAEIGPGQTALLSSGSATPATAGELEERLRQLRSTA